MQRREVLKDIGNAASKALLFEVSTTPKPGLVDRNNSGAHHDMDFFTFMVSTLSLGSYFQRMALEGYEWKGDLKSLFLKLREIGIEAEEAMFKATKNVNTHKGLIFSLGICCGVAGYYYKKEGKIESEEILYLAGDMVKDVLQDEFALMREREPLTKGEKLYREYGIKGIRGEAMGGFPNVREIGLPLLRKFKGEGRTMNESFIQILLVLLSRVEDTNVLARHNMQTLKYVQQQAELILLKGGVFTKEGIQGIYQMDDDFIQGHISPGGCADLLAVTIMMDLLSEIET